MNAFDLMKLCAQGDANSLLVLVPSGYLAAALVGNGIAFTLTGAERLEDGRLALCIQVGSSEASLLPVAPVAGQARPGWIPGDEQAAGPEPPTAYRYGGVAGESYEDTIMPSPAVPVPIGGYLLNGEAVDIHQFLDVRFPDPKAPERRQILAMRRDDVLSFDQDVVMRM